MVLREMATLWAAANFPRPDVQAYFVQQLDQAIQRQVTCSFVIGPKLTKDNKPYLVYGFRGELFVFELTSEQIARLGLKDEGMRCGEGLQPAEWNPIEPRIRLESIKVDGSPTLNREARIAGSLSYHSDRTFLGPLALHVVCEPAGCGCTTLYHHFSLLLQPKGDLKFIVDRLGDLKNRQGEIFLGIVPLFFQIWTAGELQNPQPRPAFPKQPDHLQQMLLDPRTRLPSPAQVALPETPRAQAPRLDRPISDIRAVLVEVVGGDGSVRQG
jgi:hypothetical protein